MGIAAVMIDSREPAWVKHLTFGDAPTSVVMLETGDLWVATDDGHMLIIERKTPDDLLGSLKDGRLFPQMARLAEERIMQQLRGENPTRWPYLVITGALLPGENGKVVTQRGETGWSWAAVQGALLNIQEMGVFVVYASGDTDYERAVMRLAQRKRTEVQDVLPARPAEIVSPRAAFLATLPGVGVETATAALRAAHNDVAVALVLASMENDLVVNNPVPKHIRRKVRRFLGLKDGEQFAIYPRDEKGV